MSKRVLIVFSHGLGDAAQLTVVLRHLKKYRPDWELFLHAKRGKHSVGYGWCTRVWHDQEDSPDHAAFDRVYDLEWYENYQGYTDRPNTKVTNCLDEVFNLPLDPALCKYHLHLPEEALTTARNYLESIGCKKLPNGRYNAVLAHNSGNTSGAKKNVAHEPIAMLCHTAIDAGFTPVLLDWDRRSPLPDGRRIHNPGVGAGDIWGGFGSGDAAVLTALIQQSSLFVGIDSGPQKCAGATDTPSIGLWTGHHPVQFMDLCDNFVHLVPGNHCDLPPCQGRPAVAQYFADHYRYETYEPDTFSAKLNTLALKLLGVPMETRPGLARAAGFWVPAFQPEQSWTIIQDVYVNDAYKTHLRPRRRGVEYVVDLGANIGCFSKLWHGRNPEAKIVSVECCPDLIPALKANVGDFATVIEAACTYEPGEMYLLNTFTQAGRSVGGSRVVTPGELEAESDPQYRKVRKPLDKITLEKIQNFMGWPRIDVLKLDIEASEFSVLDNCDLSRIGTMFVESHGAARWRELLGRKFAGYDVGHMYQGGAGGNFEIWHLVNPNFKP